MAGQSLFCRNSEDELQRFPTKVTSTCVSKQLTMLLDGAARMRMGDATVPLAAGDLLVIDNMKLHNPEDFPGFDTRVIVMSFLLEFVYTPGSPTCDYRPRDSNLSESR